MNFTVQRNDIASMEVDAVVLPANWRLRAGTGASMALFEAAGREELESECAIRFEQAKRQGMRLVPGVSVPTHAFDLPAKVILHTIVPKWDPKNPRGSYEDLCKSYASALVMADEMGMESIAFPVLASGNNGFDHDVAIDIAIQSLEQYHPKNKLALAYLVTFGRAITQNMKDRGYEVEEVIDQLHVLDQDMHQAEVRKADKARRRKEKNREKPFVQAKIDEAIEWIQDPKNQAVVFDFAVAIASVALPTKGAGGKVRKVLNVVAPFVRGGKK